MKAESDSTQRGKHRNIFFNMFEKAAPEGILSRYKARQSRHFSMRATSLNLTFLNLSTNSCITTFTQSLFFLFFQPVPGIPEPT